jgi:hypothetical protein
VVNLGLGWRHEATGTELNVLYNAFGRRISEVGFDRLPDVTAKQRFIDEMDRQFRTSEGAAAAFGFKDFDRVKGRLESQLRKDETRARQQSAGLSHAVKEVERRSAEGEPVNPTELAALRGQVATRGTPASSGRSNGSSARGVKRFLRIPWLPPTPRPPNTPRTSQTPIDPPRR